MTSVSDMVNNFLQAEEKNFSLFNFVNELNRSEAPNVRTKHRRSWCCQLRCFSSNV